MRMEMGDPLKNECNCLGEGHGGEPVLGAADMDRQLR